MGVRQWAGNQVMWSKHHLNFPVQALLKAGTRTILLTSGFPEGIDSPPQPDQCGVHLFKHSIVEGQTFS